MQDSAVDAPNRQRQAQLERECRELMAQLEEARNELSLAQQNAETARIESRQRDEALRRAEQRLAAQKDELARLHEDEQRAATRLVDLERQLRESETQRQQAADRAVRLDAEIRRRDALEREKPHAAATAPTTPSPAETAQRAASEVAQPAAPAKPAADESSRTWAAFLAGLREANLLDADADLPPTPELLERLGRVAAALVSFQVDMEKLVLAQVEELKRRHPPLGEAYDVLRYYQRGDRVWWWALTERAGKHVSPDRHYGAYLQHLSRMNYALLTAYFRGLLYDIATHSRLLLDPAAMRRDAGSNRKDALWDHYETRAWSTVPRRLTDACVAAFAELAAKIYHFDADDGSSAPPTP